MRYALPLAAAIMAVVTAASLPLVTAAMAQTAKPERIQFAKGASAKTIKGTLKGDQSRLFVVNVRAGQAGAKRPAAGTKCPMHRHVFCETLLLGAAL